jgi:signal transduction histidine kinase
LGLSITYQIIKKHGGTIKVESQWEKGTSFIINLPEAAENL